MSVSRPLLARLAWIVSCTILLAALLPGLAQAMQPPPPGGFMEICSAAGMGVMVMPNGVTDDAIGGATDSGGRGKPASSSSSMNCPCCAIHYGAPSLPPSDVVWMPPAALRFHYPTLFFQAPRPLFTWAPVLARGPPLNA